MSEVSQDDWLAEWRKPGSEAAVRNGLAEQWPEVECTREVEKPMALLLTDEKELVSNPENLDASVQEVFELMLGACCHREDGRRLRTAEGVEWVTAVVGFGGSLSGACMLRCGGRVAAEIAARMTGTECYRVDETVKDAIGEICNMVAGAWKSRAPNLAANCGLSVPAVIAGCDYNLRVHAKEFQLLHTYLFDDQAFEVTIVCDGLQGLQGRLSTSIQS